MRSLPVILSATLRDFQNVFIAKFIVTFKAAKCRELRYGLHFVYCLPFRTDLTFAKMQNIFAKVRSDDQNSLVEGYERRNGTSGRNRRYSKAMETRFLHVLQIGDSFPR